MVFLSGVRNYLALPKREDAMRIASLIAAAFFAAASIVPTVAEQATFIKKPKALGEKISTVITYGTRSRRNCQGRCSKGAGWDYWQCKGTSEDMTCFIDCTEPSPHGQCKPF